MSTDNDFFLLAYEGKTCSHFKQEVCDVSGKSRLHFVLVINLMCDSSKAEIIVFFQYLLDKFALQDWQVLTEVVSDFPLMFVEVGFDAIDEGIAAKTLFDGCPNRTVLRLWIYIS